MIAALLWLLPLLIAPRLFALAHGARDSDAARRFRELSTARLTTALDAGRNRRWHHVGAVIRAAESLTVAMVVVAVAGRPWWALLPAWCVTGGMVMYQFDRDFAAKFGQPKDYLGTTAATDRLAVAGGRWERGELGLTVIGALGWIGAALL